jgi:hypothetical protein
MFGTKIDQFPMARGEIKRRRCETLESSKRCISRPFEFGGVFLTLRAHRLCLCARVVEPLAIDVSPLKQRAVLVTESAVNAE